MPKRRYPYGDTGANAARIKEILDCPAARQLPDMAQILAFADGVTAKQAIAVLNAAWSGRREVAAADAQTRAKQLAASIIGTYDMLAREREQWRKRRP